ncbi:cell death abnormality protein 1-like isoform X2 [Haliotis rubra]|uniref:cell death abnormality protein 1-like isoform X2 n=1 Tax=Haliotis rubra TaxID=36100 RepID=UPI001EE53D07|nr:cell death abnormality protein 1-like isoform X2 [Haliotis rubra]
MLVQGTGGNDGYASALNICEVEIYACSPGIYGVKCNTFCHCLDSTCDRLTGFCHGNCRGNCRPGWQGQRCDTACNSTTYGTNCKKTCAERRCSSPNSSCDRRTGACDTGCLPGWMDFDCTQECANGKYGENCTSLCSERHCAGNSSCDHVILDVKLDGWVLIVKKLAIPIIIDLTVVVYAPPDNVQGTLPVTQQEPVTVDVRRDGHRVTVQHVRAESTVLSAASLVIPVIAKLHQSPATT